MLGIQRARFTLMFSYVVSRGCLFLGKPPNFIYRTRACFSSFSILATGEGQDSVLYKAVCFQQSSVKPLLWTKCWLRLTASVRKQQRKINCSQANKWVATLSPGCCTGMHFAKTCALAMPLLICGTPSPHYPFCCCFCNQRWPLPLGNAYPSGQTDGIKRAIVM